jgi:anti-sigma28 factor (negative regulator of flagellin synthesis)
MIISRAEIESLISVYRAGVKRKDRASATASAAPTTDSVEFSGELLTLADLHANFESQPYYRDAVVADLQRRIAEGRYYVPTEQIVEKIIGRLIADAAGAS